MKIILVTGGAGFIGSHLCKRLAKDGHRVISLDNYFTGSKENHVDSVEYREGHTKDIARHVPETPDTIFHLGEYARVEQSMLEPDIVHDLNINGTAGVIEYWRERKCKLVYAGSSTKFGNEGWDKQAVPYVATKAANSVRVKEVGESEGLPYAITYFYNVYGPGERAGTHGTVIEAFRRMYLAGEPITVTSPGTQRRNFTHVDDIVEGLLLVAERGHGDEYGLGCDDSFSLLEVAAELFGGDIVMLPERAGNRMHSVLDVQKTKMLGWTARRALPEYIQSFRAAHERGAPKEKRILVFSTTFYPTIGPAERALADLMLALPDLTFDIVTTKFTTDTQGRSALSKNAFVYEVGIGHSIDKFLLPFLGFRTALALSKKHHYLFAWSIMASYAALAAVLFKNVRRLPLLITLADQRLSGLPFYLRWLLRTILTRADQVYGMSSTQEAAAATLARSALARASLGRGQAFANQIRYSYTDIIRKSGDSA